MRGFLRSALQKVAPIAGNALIPGVGGLVAGALVSRALAGRNGGGGATPAQAAPSLAGWDARVGQIGAESDAARQQYLQQMQNFDPMAAATQASQAQWNLAMPQIQQQIADLRGAQASSGRLRTGFGNADQDQLLTRNFEHLNQSMAARSMEAAQMQQANSQNLGSFALGQQNMYLDATMGRYMTERDREAAEAASRRASKGAMIGAGISALGAWAGSGFSGADKVGRAATSVWNSARPGRRGS
jgi:hypothetical protein